MIIPVTIPTYNRPELLLALLQQIAEYRQHRDVQVWVWNDSSRSDYHPVEEYIFERDWLHYHRCGRNHGKKGFWELYTAMLGALRPYDFEGAYFLQDDLQLVRDFFTVAETQWRGIRDPRKLGMNLSLDWRHEACEPMWGTARPSKVKHGPAEYLRQQWTDGIFFGTRDLFGLLDWHIAPVDPTRWHYDTRLSSGVPRYITRAIARSLRCFYSPAWSLVKLHECPSQMNVRDRALATLRFYDERSLQPDPPAQPAVLAAALKVGLMADGSRGGQINEAECALLYQLALASPAKLPGVELGCYKGRSSLIIADGLSTHGSSLTIIDTFTYKKFGPSNPVAVRSELDKLHLKASIITGNSASPENAGSFRDTGVGFLCIDTDHRDEHLTKELDVWLPLMRPGSVLVVHDYNAPHWPTMPALLHSRIPDWKPLGAVELLAGFQKPS